MKKLLLVSLLTLSSAFAVAGDKGNGGGIHFCPSQRAQKFYDLYEAETRYGLEIRENNLTLAQNLARAMKKLTKFSPRLGAEVNTQLKYMMNKHVLIRPKIKLAKIEDATILVTDEACTYEQLANWDEVSGNVMVKKEYFDALSGQHQAALYLHEATYKIGREFYIDWRNVKSDLVRQMIGELFSDSDDLESWKSWKEKARDGVVVREPKAESFSVETAGNAIKINYHSGDRKYFELNDIRYANEGRVLLKRTVIYDNLISEFAELKNLEERFEASVAELNRATGGEYAVHKAAYGKYEVVLNLLKSKKKRIDDLQAFYRFKHGQTSEILTPFSSGRNYEKFESTAMMTMSLDLVVDGVVLFSEEIRSEIDAETIVSFNVSQNP